MRDAFDRADDVLRRELEAGAAALDRLVAELEALGEQAVALQLTVDRNEVPARYADEVRTGRAVAPR
jgi:hypothetical protein